MYSYLSEPGAINTGAGPANCTICTKIGDGLREVICSLGFVPHLKHGARFCSANASPKKLHKGCLLYLFFFFFLNAPAVLVSSDGFALSKGAIITLFLRVLENCEITMESTCSTNSRS